MVSVIRSTTRMKARYPMPEKSGTWAMSWATPTLKGFSRPAVKPVAAPMAIMVVPVTLSSPREWARVMPMGTKMATSVDMPMVVPKMENRVRNSGITSSSLPLKDLDRRLHMAWMAPVSLTSSKAPPMISRKVTMSEASTSARYTAPGIFKKLKGLGSRVW